MVDVGGGSTELSLAVDGLGRAVALDRPAACGRPSAGSARASSRRAASTRPAPRSTRSSRARSPTPSPPVDGVIAVAGTATTLAALDLGLAVYDPARIHGHVLTLPAIEALARRLAPSPCRAPRARAIEPDRAPVLVGGILVLAAALDAHGRASATVSERDILHGIALLAADAAPGPLTAAARRLNPRLYGASPAPGMLVRGVAGFSLLPGCRFRSNVTPLARALVAGIAERGRDATGWACRAPGEPVEIRKTNAPAARVLEEIAIPAAARRGDPPRPRVHEGRPGAWSTTTTPCAGAA